MGCALSPVTLAYPERNSRKQARAPPLDRSGADCATRSARVSERLTNSAATSAAGDRRGARPRARGLYYEQLAELGIPVQGEIGGGDPDLVTPPPAFANEERSAPWLSAARLERVLIPPVIPGELLLVSVELLRRRSDPALVREPGGGRAGTDGTFTQIADDLGTRYHAQSGGGGGDQFAPAIPAEATALRVTRGSIEIELGLADEH
jgi:hypothetical protein